MGEYGIFHVFNKSIAGYTIFNTSQEYKRMLMLLMYYQQRNPPMRFSRYVDQEKSDKGLRGKHIKDGDNLVRIMAYCLMPTHFHFLLEPLAENAISIFTNNVLNSYSRYFNLRHNRQGPLWVGRSKKVRVENDEVLWHLTRYIHLNPVTGSLTEKPDSWKYSSYQEYVEAASDGICDFKNFLRMDPLDYKKFVEDHADYQRELAKIKHLILE